MSTVKFVVDKCFENRQVKNLVCLTLYKTTKFLTSPNSKHLQTTNKYVQKLHLVHMGMVENIFGKGENAGYQHFLLFPKYFQNCFEQGGF